MKYSKFKTFADLFFVFFKTGLFTFGGGYAMLPALQKELVDKKNWCTEEELIDYFAIGQSTPGIIAVNVATFVGFKMAGFFGSVVATCAIVLPSFVIISVLSKLISSVNDFPWAKKVLNGINVSVAALLTDTSINFAKKILKNFYGIILALVSFFLVYFLKIPTFAIILGSAIIGEIIYFIQKKKAVNE